MGKDRQRARQGEAAQQLPAGAGGGAPDLAGAGSLPEAGLGSDLASGIAASGVAGAAADHADDAGTQHAPESAAELEVCPAGMLVLGADCSLVDSKAPADVMHPGMSCLRASSLHGGLEFTSVRHCVAQR